MAASGWLTQLPNGSSRDTAITAFIGKVGTSDPEGADQWAESITDPGQRTSMVTTVLGKWMQSDPADATVAVQKSSLSPEAKAALLPKNQL